MSLSSRRSALRRLGVGVGTVLAGCSGIRGGNSSSTAPAETPRSSPESPSTCYHSEFYVDEITEADLEDGEYEVVEHDELPASQQATFEEALTTGSSNVSDERRWYKVIEYKGDEHWIPLVVRYNDTLYEVAVAHVDHAC